MPIEEVSVEEFCARVLGCYFDALLRGIGPNVLVIDYEDITPKCVVEIMNFFGLDAPASPMLLEAVFGKYSKDPTGKRAFQDDRVEKLRAANPAIWDAANRWAIPKYSQVRSAGKQAPLALRAAKT
jgi:hypothetical protein